MSINVVVLVGNAGRDPELRFFESGSCICEFSLAINRPPRDGRMAFVRSPDGISVELLQDGPALAPAEPWLSMPNIGSW
jgi:lactoylglutathione lyase